MDIALRPEYHVRGSKRFLAAMAVCNLVLPLVAVSTDRFESVWVATMSTFFGIVAAQFGILSIWFVWSGGSTVRRGLSLVCIAMMLCLCALLGFWGPFLFVEMGQEFEDWAVPWPWMVAASASAIVALLPISLAVQLPLWVSKLVFRWQIAREGDAASVPHLSIGSMLTATALVALGLGCVRLHGVLFVMYIPVVDDSAFGLTHWKMWGSATVAIVVISTAVVLPMNFLALRPTTNAVAVIATLAFSLGTVLMGFVTELPLAWLVPGGEITTPLMATGFVATLSVPLFMARSQGYQLKIGRSHSPTLPLSPSP